MGGLGAISGPITCDSDRGAPRLRRGATSDGGFGSHLGAPSPATLIEARHGSAGARRAMGGLGAHLGAPSPATLIEARHGSAGARRAMGVWGPSRGPHVNRQHARSCRACVRRSTVAVIRKLAIYRSRASDTSAALSLDRGDAPAWGGTVDHNRPAGAKPAPDRHRAMNMDTWYELVLREMSDLNGVANELLREADEVSRARDE